MTVYILSLFLFLGSLQAQSFFPSDLVPEVELSAQAMNYYRPRLLLDLPHQDDFIWEVFHRRLKSDLNLAGTLEVVEGDSTLLCDRLEWLSSKKRPFKSGESFHELQLRQSADSLGWASFTVELNRENALLQADDLAAEILLLMTGFQAPFDTRLVFVEPSRSGGHLMLADFFGERIQALSKGGVPKLSPCFSPDAHGFAYVGIREESGADIFLGDTRTGKATLLLGGETSESAPAFSPDGQWLACAATVKGNTDIYLLPVAGGRPKRLTFSKGIDTNPSFSPDGRRLVFASDRSGRLQLYSVGAEGLDESRLLRLPAPCDCPAWSPDGEWIVFSLRESNGFQLHMVRPDGSELTRLSDLAGNHFDPAWSPDSQLLAFTYKNNIWIASADGSKRRRLSPRGGSGVAWARRPLPILSVD
jgi:TolB protein